MEEGPEYCRRAERSPALIPLLFDTIPTTSAHASSSSSSSLFTAVLLAALPPRDRAPEHAGASTLMVWALSATQQGFEERSRTISLAVVALGVLICGLRFFKDALIPLVLAIALKHLLQPVINVLTNRPLRCCGRELLAEPMACVGVPRRNRRLQTCLAYACRLQLSRTAAAIVSLLLAFAVLGAILAIVADSVHVLADNAEEYAKQLKVTQPLVLAPTLT